MLGVTPLCEGCRSGGSHSLCLFSCGVANCPAPEGSSPQHCHLGAGACGWCQQPSCCHLNYRLKGHPSGCLQGARQASSLPTRVLCLGLAVCVCLDGMFLVLWRSGFSPHPNLAGLCSLVMENSRGPLKQDRFSSARRLPSQGMAKSNNVAAIKGSRWVRGLPCSPHLQLSKQAGHDCTVHSCWKYQNKIKASGDSSSKGRFERTSVLPSSWFYLWLTTWKRKIPSERILPSLYVLFACLFLCEWG